MVSCIWHKEPLYFQVNAGRETLAAFSKLPDSTMVLLDGTRDMRVTGEIKYWRKEMQPCHLAIMDHVSSGWKNFLCQ